MVINGGEYTQVHPVTTNESLSWRICSSMERGGGMPVMPKTKMTAEEKSPSEHALQTQIHQSQKRLISAAWACHTAYSFPLHPPTVLAIEMSLETLYWLIHGLIPFAKSVASAKCFLHTLRGN